MMTSGYNWTTSRFNWTTLSSTPSVVNSPTSYQQTGVPNGEPARYLVTRQIAICSVLMVIGVIGNMSVVVTIRGKLVKNATFAMILNLAVSDGILVVFLWYAGCDFHVLIFGPPKSESQIAAREYIRHGEDVGVASYTSYSVNAITLMFTFSSTYMLVALAAVRFYILGFPIEAHANLTIGKIRVLFSAVWSTSFIYGTTFFCIWVLASPQFGGKYGRYIDIIMLAVVLYFFPLLVLTVLHFVKLFCVLRKRPISGTNATSEKRMTVTVVTLVISFAVLYLPYAIHSVSTNDQLEDLFYEIRQYTQMLNCVINPFIYVIFSEQFCSKIRGTRNSQITR